MVKPIKGFENYLIDESGNIWNSTTGKKLKPSLDLYGYLRLELQKDGRPHYKSVHRLVAETFISNPDGLPQVNHKDENKQNNHVSNLEWCTAKYNTNYGTHNARVSKSKINHPKRSKPVLCIETGIIYPSIHEAARQTGIDDGNIGKVCKGKYKQINGFSWKYATESECVQFGAQYIEIEVIG